VRFSQTIKVGSNDQWPVNQLPAIEQGLMVHGLAPPRSLLACSLASFSPTGQEDKRSRNN
jgi:hypothetical protein